MFDLIRKPDIINIICDDENTDAIVNLKISDRKLSVYITAYESYPQFICLRWHHKFNEQVKIMGDKWERAYADMAWNSLNAEIFMPWYFLTFNGKETVCSGVMTQPNSFVSFQCDASGITAWFDVRCGGKGVHLNGRELLAGVLLCEKYNDISPYAAAKQFCKMMCSNPIFPKEPVYGSNNWYYAYGKSSYEEIIRDANVIAELTKENENRPFMVIDDGWSVNSCAGPWRANAQYGDMKKIADEFKEIGVKPGIWFRPLYDVELQEKHPEWRLKKTINSYGDTRWLKTDNGFLGFLDPSVEGVKEYLRKTIRTFKKWGYELIKHDFSTYDMFDEFGFTLNGVIAPNSEWSFSDNTKTSAEIVLDFYRLFREEAGDMIIIGCNTISHLCAGLVEVNRIGDDTSGNSWSRTRAYGVNSLAFRMCQNDTFYKVDADCVGIRGELIDWKLNRQWLDLLAKSGSPLFVSAQPDSLTEEMKKDLEDAFKINSLQENTAEPLDWLYNNSPHTWLIDGEKCEYDFIMDSIPVLMSKKHSQPH